MKRAWAHSKASALRPAAVFNNGLTPLTGWNALERFRHTSIMAPRSVGRSVPRRPFGRCSRHKLPKYLLKHFSQSQLANNVFMLIVNSPTLYTLRLKATAPTSQRERSRKPKYRDNRQHRHPVTLATSPSAVLKRAAPCMELLSTSCHF